jgi:hypothetical protein
MRQGRRPSLDKSVVIQEVEIKRTGRVGDVTCAAELRLHLMQQSEQRLGGKFRIYARHRVYERGVARIRPGGVSVETRLLFNRYASTGEFAQSGHKRLRGLTCRGRDIRS